jgi:hypothetical protein
MVLCLTNHLTAIVAADLTDARIAPNPLPYATLPVVFPPTQHATFGRFVRYYFSLEWR